jgi:apolipoprotein N-acyltransferase
MKERLIRLFLALLSGFLLGLSFPGLRLSFCAWLALVPLFLALSGTDRKQAFLLSWAAGFCFFGTIYHWGFVFGVHVWLAISLWQGFYMGLCGAFIAPALDNKSGYLRILLPALIWTGYEYVRSLGLLGLNWGSLAYSQFRFLAIIQVAGLTGMYGISFMIALFNSMIAELLMLIHRNRGTHPLHVLRETVARDRAFAITALLALLIPLAALCYGFGVIIRDHAREHLYPRIRISTVQPNMDMCLKWDPFVQRRTLDALEGLTVKGKEQGGSLFFWPETAIPTVFPHNLPVRNRILSFAARERIYLLAGAPTPGPGNHTFNAAYLITPEGAIAESYSKRHIVPFGEFLPLEKYLRKYHLFDRVQNNLPGPAWKIFTTPMARFAVLICFESDFPDIARINIQRGAQFLAVITNDAWFERSSAAEHHISWDVLRAAENHANIVQSANTGICAFIDYNGRIKSSTEIYHRDVLTDDLMLLPAGTFYTVAGDYFPLLCLLGAIVLPRLPGGLKVKKKSQGRRKKG